MNKSTTYLFSEKLAKSTPSVESGILILFSKTNSDEISIYLSSAERDVRGVGSEQHSAVYSPYRDFILFKF